MEKFNLHWWMFNYYNYIVIMSVKIYQCEGLIILNIIIYENFGFLEMGE